MEPFKHILVAIDFGETTQPTLDLALVLAHSCDARITLLHSFDTTPFIIAAPFTPFIDLEPIASSLEKQLGTLLAKVKGSWEKSDARLRRGLPHESILEEARLAGCDLILVGTHGRRGVARAVLGSVAEKVVRMSPIPVLTVHAASKTAKDARPEVTGSASERPLS